jgi:single-strand DNA-binding protein
MAKASTDRAVGRQRGDTSRREPTDDPDDEGPAHVNEVRLVGRLAVAPVHKELPSGDPLVSFRLVVERDLTARRSAANGGRSAANGGSSRSPTVDTLECSAWRRDVQRTMARVEPGEVLEVSGALRRRFWRTGTGAASRSEVEVLRVRRLG